MQPTVLCADLKNVLKKLKLGHLIATLPDRLVLADKQQLNVEDTLLLVLSDEVSRRESTAAQRRADRAGLDPAMQLERWDGTTKVRYDKRVLAEVASLRFVQMNKNALILGPVGVGKTFLASAIGHIACRHGYNVHFTRADAMLRRLKQSHLDNSRDALLTELCTVDLLIVDDFALEPIVRRPADAGLRGARHPASSSRIITSIATTDPWSHHPENQVVPSGWKAASAD